MKPTRRALRRIQLTLAVRRAEQEAPRLNYDKLIEAVLPFP